MRNVWSKIGIQPTEVDIDYQRWLDVATEILRALLLDSIAGDPPVRQADAIEWTCKVQFQAYADTFSDDFTSALQQIREVIREYLADAHRQVSQFVLEVYEPFINEPPPIVAGVLTPEEWSGIENESRKPCESLADSLTETMAQFR